eukprot:TRINITY_DN21781_c0_g1_i1.p2 TRINITY_DN21781_c0_g1~~TRINITY_DN21781_c0_g1_i1.p2  ORF type:complete len:153 (+),score=30.06 TRINITY_DN21781_c0_g1_i1:295-753(+)
MTGMDLKSWLKPESKSVTGQRLIFEGHDVADDRTLEDQKFVSGAVVYRIPLIGFFTPHIQHAVPPPESVSLQCIPNNQTLQIDVQPTDSVATLTAKIEDKFGHRKGTYYRLFYRGVALGEQPFQTLPDLQHYGIPDKAVIYLFTLKDQEYQD